MSNKTGITVRDLIKELMEYNMDTEVVISTSETIEISYTGVTDNGDTSDKLVTPFVFIDGCDYEPFID